MTTLLTLSPPPGNRALLDEVGAQEFIEHWIQQIEEAGDHAKVNKVVLAGRSYTAEAATLIAGFLNLHVDFVTIVDLRDMIASLPRGEAFRVLTILCDIFKYCSLEEVDLSDNAMGSEGIALCDSVLSFQTRTLKSLKLCNNGLSEDTMSEVVDILTRRDQDGACACDILEVVHFYNNMSGNDGAESFERILNEAKSLKDVRYSGCRVYSEGGKALAHGLDSLGDSMENIERLDLEGCAFGSGSDHEDGVIPLSNALGRAKNLTYVNLCDCNFMAMGMKTVAKALRTAKPRLIELDVSENEIGRKGAKYVAKLIEDNVTTLRVFQSDVNELTSLGVQILVEALSSDQSVLEELRLDQNECGHMGAQALVNATLPNLQSIHLDLNGFSEEDVELLEETFGDKLHPMDENDEDADFDDDLEEEEEEEASDDEDTVEHFSSLYEEPATRTMSDKKLPAVTNLENDEDWSAPVGEVSRDDTSNLAALAAEVVGRNSANRQENLKLLANVRREHSAQMAARLRSDEEKLAARYTSDEEKLAADIAQVERKDEEEKEALLLVLQQNIGGGTRVMTPGPTPAHSRSSSRSASPVSGGRCLNFATPAKRAKTRVMLSPVCSVGSSGDEVELEGVKMVEGTKIPAVTSSSNKSFCLFVASGMERDLTEPTKIEMMLDNLPVDIKAIAQVEDCTCLLQADGKIWPAVHFVPGREWGWGGSLQVSQGSPFDLGEPIDGIQSWGRFLLATGASGRLYMLEYLANTGTFNKPATLDLAAASDDGGAVAIGPDFLHWFGKELGDLGSCGVLHALPLDGIGTADLSEDTGAIELPKLRVKAKIAAGGDQVLVLAFDKYSDGKLYTMHKGKLEKVNKFQNGVVQDIAASTTFGFVSTAAGQVSYSENSREWCTVFDEGVYTVQKLAAGETFALGATLQDTVVVMKPFTETSKKANQVGEWDFSKHASGPIDKIAFMDGSASFACVLVQVKADDNDVATKEATTEVTDTTD